MNFLDCLDKIEDPRQEINKSYDLSEIIFLTMAAVLSGADGWKSIALFGEAKLDWLRQVMPFKSGIPTRHTLGRIIRGISADALMDVFAIWINACRSKSGQAHIVFDGKTLKGSSNKHVEALHLMNVMVVDSGLMIYQKPSDGKKNEIKTMQSLLDCIPVKGTVISADAMHCQRETADKIIHKKADYVLQVKKLKAIKRRDSSLFS